jgi:hypothetical protein
MKISKGNLRSRAVYPAHARARTRTYACTFLTHLLVRMLLVRMLLGRMLLWRTSTVRAVVHVVAHMAHPAHTYLTMRALASISS